MKVKSMAVIRPWLIVALGCLPAFALALCFLTLSAHGTETKRGVATRQLVFPKEFSCGQLYCYTKESYREWLTGASDAKKLGHRLGEARGTVKVPSGPDLYLIASYDLVGHPEALYKLKPDDLSCLSFGRIGFTNDLDPVIAPVSHLTGLKRLEFDSADLVDAHLEKLASLVNLQSLTLTVCSIRGTCFEKLTPLTRLKELVLAENQLDSHACSYISNYPSLVCLNLSHCGVKDADIVALSKLKQLKHLWLGRSLITAKGLALLRNFKGLVELDLWQTKLSVNDLCCLEGSKLPILYLPEDRYAASDLKRLKKALPYTELRVNGIAGCIDTNTFFAPLH
jgi:hypothetical protein